MQEFAQWSLDAIREESGSLSWLEESRFLWTTSTSQALGQLLDAKTIILITDEKREWFGQYMIEHINSSRVERPLIAVVKIESFFPHFCSVVQKSTLDALENMLDLAFKGEYFFFYVGKGDDRRAEIAKRRDSSYMWLFDEEYLNAFSLKSYDKELDIKLLQLFRLLDRSIDATIYGEVELGS
ncbi:MAG: HobA family DNA replication regulator [Sulfuricurvum sp.]